MNEVQIKYENNQMLVTSLQVARDFKKQHKHVLEAIREIKGVAENWADLFHKTTYIHEQNHQEYPMYLMNRDGFTLLTMGFTGKEALEWKLKYINAFNKMEAKLNSPEFIMNRALELSKQRCDALLLENQELKPKALFADAVATSKTSILVGDLSKILKQNGINIGANRLFAELRDKGYLIKRKGSDWNMPTQKSMDMELFEIKEHTHIDGNGCNVTTKTPKVTGKGQVYFVNKFLGDRL
ncbi:MAG: phage antirepressor KilAC domain-containing protein [Thomasclavelia ramosa]